VRVRERRLRCGPGRPIRRLLSRLGSYRTYSYKESRPVPLIEQHARRSEPTGAPTTVGVELLPCAALTLSVLALTAQSETSMIAAMAHLRNTIVFHIYTVFVADRYRGRTSTSRDAATEFL